MAIQTLALLALVLYLVHTTYSKFSIYLEGRRFATAHGCKPPFALPQQERILGFEEFLDTMRSRKNNVILSRNLKRMRVHGPTFSSVSMGRYDINTTDPENIKTVLSTSFEDYSLGHRLKIFGSFIGNGIFTSDGAHWAQSRALIRPSFNKSQVADLDIFETHIQTLIGIIPRDGSTVDLQPLFYKLAFDSATEFLMGESVNSLFSIPGSEQEKLGEAFEYAKTHLPTLPLQHHFHRPKYQAAVAVVHKFVDKHVETFLKKEKLGLGERYDQGRYVFLPEVVKVMRDPIRLRNEALNLLIAGRDTTSGLLSNIFYVLARRPDIWQKLKEEVSMLKGGQPDYETLRGMKYVKNVVNESLRLFPPVPQNGRTAVRNTTLPRGGGPEGLDPIFVPKGSLVRHTIWATHRRKDIYGEDADDFNPDRWNDENLRPGWGFLPFNGGPRICVGQQFALTETSYTIVRLVQAFKEVENRDEVKDWVPCWQLTLSSGTGTKVALIPI